MRDKSHEKGRNLNRAVKKKEKRLFFSSSILEKEMNGGTRVPRSASLQSRLLREKWVWQESSISLLLLPYFNKSLLVHIRPRRGYIPRLGWITPTTITLFASCKRE